MIIIHTLIAYAIPTHSVGLLVHLSSLDETHDAADGADEEQWRQNNKEQSNSGTTAVPTPFEDAE